MPYAVQADVEKVLSELGVTLRIDDNANGVGETTNLTYALEEASEQVDFHLLQRYTASDLTASDYVTKATAAIAACLLSRRRANSVPPSLGQSCEKYEKQLKMIMDGDAELPGATLRDDPGITTSGLNVDLTRPDMPVRRSRLRSTGDPPPSTVKDFETREFEFDL